jgi:hypothetical protein
MDLWLWTAFADNRAALGGIAGIDREQSFLRSIKESPKLEGGEAIDIYIRDLGVFVAFQRNRSLGNIKQDLKFQREAGSVGDHCLGDVGLFNDKFIDFPLDFSSIFLVGILISGVDVPLVQ